MQKKWLDEDNGSDIAVFVVWSPQLGAEIKHVAEAAELIPDPRARHYWDGDMVIGGQYQALLHPDGKELTLGSPAWDVWLLFGPDVRWDGDQAPKPTWWEHQLRGMPEDVKLDPERFAEKAAQLRGASATE